MCVRVYTNIYIDAFHWASELVYYLCVSSQRDKNNSLYITDNLSCHLIDLAKLHHLILYRYSKRQGYSVV